MREAYEDARAGSLFIPSADVAGEVDGAQQVINAASAVQAVRVAQYAGREQEQDGTGAWVDVDYGVGHVSEFASECFGPMLAMSPVAASRNVSSILEKFDTRIARILLDERTGIVIETGIDEYRPNPSMRRFIQRRDSHCRFPGCRRNAKRCEPDHVIPFSRGGPTAIWNLVSLCKHHHRVKHQAGWALSMTPAGECTWTDPHGRQYATHPIDHHELAA